MRYLPLTPDDRAAMLAADGASSIDDLFVDVPAAARLSGPIERLPAPASDLEEERHMAAQPPQNRAAAARNTIPDAGAYRHPVPSIVYHLLPLEKYFTASTPQPPSIAPKRDM